MAFLHAAVRPPGLVETPGTNSLRRKVGASRAVRATAATPGNVGPIYAGTNELTACPGGCAPPDPHAAAGTDYVGETTNTRVEVFSKNTGAVLQSRSHATFFGYTATDIFDARILKDPWSNRWMITAIGDNEFSNPGAPQYLFIALSYSTDLLGSWCIWTVNVDFNGNEFFDYPQIGVDQNSMIVSGNVFSNSPDAFKYGEVLTFPKATLLNCQAITSYKTFKNLPSTLEPPVVYDTNAKTFFLSAPSSGSSIALYAGQNLGNPSTATLSLQANIPVSAYTMPADAAQCVVSNTPITTLDARFQNFSTQRGNSLWNTHTTSFSASNARATPRFYELNTATNTVARTGQFLDSGASNDWNPAVSVNSLGEAAFTWSSDSTQPCVNPRVVATGYQPPDNTTLLGNPGLFIAGSGSYYNAPNYALESPPCQTTPFVVYCARWGDYAAVTLDPSTYTGCAANRRMWLVNERVRDNSSTTWATRIARVGFC